MAKSRILSPEQVELLIDISLAAEPEWCVLVCSPDDNLSDGISRLFAGDTRLRVDHVRYGADALVRCARSRYDMVVVDRAMDDIPPAVLVAALRRVPDLSDLIVLGTGDRKDGDFGADDYFAVSDFDKVYLKRKLGVLLPARSRKGGQTRGERRWPRIGLNVIGRIQATCAGEMNEVPERVEGTAVIENISPGGAFLTGIHFDRDIPLADAFTVRLDVDEPPLERWSADSTVVERTSEGGVRVHFIGISRENQNKVTGLFAE